MNEESKVFSQVQEELEHWLSLYLDSFAQESDEPFCTNHFLALLMQLLLLSLLRF
jgi:hypothetical protein